MLLFKSLEDLRLELANIKNKSSNLDTEYNEKQKRKLILEEDITGKSAILEESKRELENIKNELLFKEKAKKEVEKEVVELEEKRSNTIENIRNKENQNRNFEVDKIKLNAENDDLEKRINLANVRINTISLEKVELEKDFVRVQDELAKAEKVNETNLDEKDKLNDKFSETEIKLKELEIEKNK